MYDILSDNQSIFLAFDIAWRLITCLRVQGQSPTNIVRKQAKNSLVMFPIPILFLLTASVFGKAIDNNNYKDLAADNFGNNGDGKDGDSNSNSSNSIGDVHEGDTDAEGKRDIDGNGAESDDRNIDSDNDVEDEVLRTLFEELESDLDRRWDYPRMATVLMVPAGPNSMVYGRLKVYEFRRSGLLVKGQLFNLTPGLHGFHVHVNGSTENNCTATGPHFNPDNVTHGGPQTPIHHAGDLGNVLASSSGIAKIKILTKKMTLNPASPYYIMGRSFAVHVGQDDLGLGSNSLSLSIGNSGIRQACGIIVPRYK